MQPMHRVKHAYVALQPETPRTTRLHDETDDLSHARWHRTALAKEQMQRRK